VCGVDWLGGDWRKASLSRALSLSLFLSLSLALSLSLSLPLSFFLSLPFCLLLSLPLSLPLSFSVSVLLSICLSLSLKRFWCGQAGSGHYWAYIQQRNDSWVEPIPNEEGTSYNVSEGTSHKVPSFWSESRGQQPALNILCVPYSLVSRAIRTPRKRRQPTCDRA